MTFHSGGNFESGLVEKISKNSPKARISIARRDENGVIRKVSQVVAARNLTLICAGQGKKQIPPPFGLAPNHLCPVGRKETKFPAALASRLCLIEMSEVNPEYCPRSLPRVNLPAQSSYYSLWNSGRKGEMRQRLAKT